MSNEASFMINGTPAVSVQGDRIFRATPNQLLTIQLENDLDSAAPESVVFELYNASIPDSPPASKGAPQLTWTQNGLTYFAPVDPYSAGNIQLPAGVHSYVVRATVRLRATNPTGQDVLQTNVFERLVAIESATSPALRKTVPSETTQGEARGTSDNQNSLIDYLLELAESGSLSQWNPVAFSANLPFDRATTMPQQILTTGTVFSPVTAGAVAGSSCYVRLIANDSITPTFSGMVEHESSSGWDVSSGALNILEAWYDGVDYWYRFTRAAQPVNLDIITPSFVSAAIANATPTLLIVTLSEPLDPAFLGGTVAINNTGGADTGTITSISGSTFTVTKTRTTLSTDVVTVAFTQAGANQVRDLAGNLLASFGAQAVTNNVINPFARLQTRLACNEGGDGVTGWTYTSTAAPARAYNSSLKIPAKPSAGVDVNFSIEWVIVTPVNFCICYLRINSGDGAWNSSPGTNQPYGIYSTAPFAVCLVTRDSTGATPNVNTTQTMIAGTKFRLRRVGTTVFADVASDGTNFVNIHQWTGQSTAPEMFPTFQTAGTGTTIGRIIGTGLVPA